MLMKLNEQLVSEYLVTRKAFPGKNGCHRSNISADLGMAWSTVYDTLVRLEQKGIVYRHSEGNGKVGRGMVFWCLTTEEF